jgi:hypothetical protein
MQKREIEPGAGAAKRRNGILAEFWGIKHSDSFAKFDTYLKLLTNNNLFAIPRIEGTLEQDGEASGLRLMRTGLSPLVSPRDKP